MDPRRNYMGKRDFFVGVQERAEFFLEHRTSLPLSFQFANRRIIEIKRTILDYFKAHLFLTPEDCFSISLKEEDPIEEHLLSIGHELAHTFEFFDGDIFLRSPYHLSRYDNAYFTDPFHVATEKFCDKFALHWLECGNVREELTYLLRESEGKYVIFSLASSEYPYPLRPIAGTAIFLPALYSQLRFSFPP